MNLSNTTSALADYDENYDEDDITTYWQYRMYSTSFLYVAPVLIITGTVCNVLTLITMCTKAYRGSTTGFMLSALAIADIGVLNTGLLRNWIRVLIDVDVRELSQISCRVHLVCTYLFGHLSAWTLSLVTLERVVCVCLPFKCREIFNLRKTVAGWLTVLGLLLAANLHFFWTAKIDLPNEGRCSYDERYKRFLTVVWQWLDLFLVCFGPFGVIFVGNVIIVYKIAARSLHQKRTLNASSSAVSNSSKRTTSTTVMLLVVSIAFLLTTTPSTIYFLGNAYVLWSTATVEDTARVFGAYALCSLLYYLNSTINFFLYCASGTKFRAAIRSLMCRQPIRGVTRQETVVAATKASASAPANKYIVSSKAESSQD